MKNLTDVIIESSNNDIVNETSYNKIVRYIKKYGFSQIKFGKRNYWVGKHICFDKDLNELDGSKGIPSGTDSEVNITYDMYFGFMLRYHVDFFKNTLYCDGKSINDFIKNAKKNNIPEEVINSIKTKLGIN